MKLKNHPLIRFVGRITSEKNYKGQKIYYAEMEVDCVELRAFGHTKRELWDSIFEEIERYERARYYDDLERERDQYERDSYFKALGERYGH